MSDDWKGFVLCFMLVNLPGDSTLQWAMFSVPGNNTWFDVKNLVLCCVYIVLYLNTIVLSTTELMDGNLPCNHDSWSTCAQCWFVWYFSSAVIYSRGNVACVHVHVVHLVGDTGECNCETANLLLLLLQLFVWFVMYMYVWCCCMSPHSVATASDICSCYTAPPPLTFTWPRLRCDVGLEEGEYRENCLCLAVLCNVYYYNGAQRYEQFLQVGWLYRALVLLGLALSSECLCFLLTFFSLPCSELSLVGLALDVVD